MSGQPYVYGKDVDMYRQRYMDTLNITAGINDMNLQANKTYKATGQLPPQSSMPDNRTTSEKLGDIEKLKVSLIATLRPIMDSQMAQSVLQQIQNSPYNADGSLFNFFAQRSKAIVEQLSKIYSFGIKGDQNDVTKFVSYVVQAFVQTKSFDKISKDSFNSTTGQLYSNMTEAVSANIANSFTSIVAKIQTLAFMNDRDMARIRKIDDKLHNFLEIISGRSFVYVTVPSTGRDMGPGRESSSESGSHGSSDNSLVIGPRRGRSDSDESVSPGNEVMIGAPRGEPAYDDNARTIRITNSPAGLFNAIRQLQDSGDGSDVGFTAIYATYEQYMKLVEEFPRPENFNTLLKQMETAIANKNFTLFDTILTKFDELIPDVHLLHKLSVDFINDVSALRTLRNRAITDLYLANQQALEAGQRYQFQGTTWVPGTSDTTGGYMETDLFGEPAPLQNTAVGGPLSRYEHGNVMRKFVREGARAPVEQGIIRGDALQENIDLIQDIANREAEIQRLIGIRDDPSTSKSTRKTTSQKIKQLREYQTIVKGSIADRGGPHSYSSGTTIEGTQAMTPTEAYDIAAAQRGLTERLRALGIDDPNALPDMSGHGIRRRPGRPKGCGIKTPFIDKVNMSAGLDPEPRYIKFGKYVINSKKLNDGVFSLRHKTGANIVGHPSIKISNHMQRVLKRIIGGGLPNFEDMSNLTEDERRYLYNVSHKADIIDKINIPAPSRDQQDKDNHNFEVMKGEIMSGNDNKDLVKKFKILILKMSKSGELPKSQVNELLTDLAELGY